MCAPHELRAMEQASISRFNSQSTNRTLIGSDDGLVSPLLASFASNSGSVSSPIVQTSDNRQWIDLDVLSPKLVKELRRQYDPSIKDEPIGPLEKGAAKIKAFVRQTKHGIDFRLRRRLSEKDEVFDISLVSTSPVPQPEFGDEKLPLIPELPGTVNEVNELPDTSTALELDAAQPPSRTSTGDSIGEPLPRYEPRRSSSDPLLTVGDVGQGSDVPLRPSITFHKPSASQSSIIATPKRGLSVSDHEFRNMGNESSSESEPKPGRSIPLEALNEDSPGSERERPGHQLIQEPSIAESLQTILLALQEKNSATQDEPDRFTQSPPNRETLGSFKVAKTTQYETETDAEPLSPVIRKASNRSRKPGIILPKRKRRAATSRTKSSDSLDLSADSDEDVQSGHGLLRMQTIPKRLTASSGAEALWLSLIKSQGNLLGAEHPLVYQAKSDLAHSRKSGHAKGSTNLSSLERSQMQAAEMLGLAHPRVHAFTDELKTLQFLIGSESETINSSHIDPNKPEAGIPPSNAVADLQVSPERPSAPNSPIGDSRELNRFPPTSPVSQAQQVTDNRSTDILPESSDRKPELPRLTTSVPLMEQQCSPVESAAANLALSNGNWNTWHTPHRPSNSYGMLLALTMDAVVSGTMKALQWLQRTYGPEQPLEPGKVRVRWTCSCGEQLHDDFVERKRGGARRLEALLNRPRVHAPANGTSPTTPCSSQASNSFASSTFGFPPSSQTSWSSLATNGQGSMRGNSDSKHQHSTSTLSIPSQYHPFYEPPWLLTCANEDRYTPKLAHLDMAPHKITSDKDLAKALREHYFNVNKRWYRTLRLRGLNSVEFVQLEVHQNRFADIRKCPDMPELSTGDYTFEPSDLMPPVGSSYLLHLFKHPEDYDGELIAYLRFPKRNERLPLGVGWGINLVEGFLAERVWILVSTFFALGSIAFAISWTLKDGDVQGASGIAAWILSFSILIFGWLQSFLG